MSSTLDNDVLSLEDGINHVHAIHTYETDDKEQLKMFEFMDAGFKARASSDYTRSLQLFKSALVILEQHMTEKKTVSNEKLHVLSGFHRAIGFNYKYLGWSTKALVHLKRAYEICKSPSRIHHA